MSLSRSNRLTPSSPLAGRRRWMVATALGVGALTISGSALAQAATPLKFQLDWRFEGPSALFLLPIAKGYFKKAGLDVSLDAGNGSGGAVTSRYADRPRRPSTPQKTPRWIARASNRRP